MPFHSPGKATTHPSLRPSLRYADAGTGRRTSMFKGADCCPAPQERRAKNTSSRLFAMETCRDVQPLVSRAFTSAPASRSNSTTYVRLFGEFVVLGEGRLCPVAMNGSRLTIIVLLCSEHGAASLYSSARPCVSRMVVSYTSLRRPTFFYRGLGHE